VRVPVALGVNVTEIVQLAPTASVAVPLGHVLVCAKSTAFAPPIAILEIDNGAVPLFVKLTDCAALVLATNCDPKLKPVGETVTAGAVPVPDRATL
jgi:hypothetical protein